MNIKCELPIERNDVEIILDVEFDYEPFQPAVTWGPADNWRPAEGGAESPVITLNGKVWDGVLDRHEQARLETLMEEAIASECESPDPDDYYEPNDCGDYPDEVNW